MNKKELLTKLKDVEGLSKDEKAYLTNLINTKKKYGLVWEDKPEEVEEELRHKLPILKEVKERAIINDAPKNLQGFENLEGLDKQAPNHILIEGDNLHALNYQIRVCFETKWIIFKTAIKMLMNKIKEVLLKKEIKQVLAW